VRKKRKKDNDRKSERWRGKRGVKEKGLTE
jgi:hypothetical protein